MIVTRLTTGKTSLSAINAIVAVKTIANDASGAAQLAPSTPCSGGTCHRGAETSARMDATPRASAANGEAQPTNDLTFVLVLGRPAPAVRGTWSPGASTERIGPHASVHRAPR